MTSRYAVDEKKKARSSPSLILLEGVVNCGREFVGRRCSRGPALGGIGMAMFPVMIRFLLNSCRHENIYVIGEEDLVHSRRRPCAREIAWLGILEEL